jgi:nucleoside-diphosphate-sugar epimerase
VSAAPAVLVTGGAGFVGSYVVRDLLREGARVVLVDNAPTHNVFDSVLGEADRGDLRIEEGDVTDAWRLLRICERHGVDRVVHLASPLTSAIRASPVAGLSVACLGTANIFEAARVLGLRRVVWASSIAVFGPLGDAPLGNGAPRRPESLYGSAKVLCEDLAAAYRSDAGVDSIGLRLSVLYGPWRLRGWGPSFGTDSDPIRSAMLGQPIAVHDPELRLDWLYVEDAAALVARALEVPTPIDHVFNTSGEPATRREFAERIAEVVPSSVVVVEDGQDSTRPPSDGPIFDDSALRSQIGYPTHHTLHEGIEATVAVYDQPASQSESRV